MAIVIERSIINPIASMLDKKLSGKKRDETIFSSLTYSAIIRQLLYIRPMLIFVCGAFVYLTEIFLWLISFHFALSMFVVAVAVAVVVIALNSFHSEWAGIHVTTTSEQSFRFSILTFYAICYCYYHYAVPSLPLPLSSYHYTQRWRARYACTYACACFMLYPI